MVLAAGDKRRRIVPRRRACFAGGVSKSPTEPCRYLDIEMPDWFILEAQNGMGRWIDHGRYRSDAFDRHEDGTYVCVPDAGTPIYLRCLRERDDVIEVVDGTGERFTYRLVPFPSYRYWPSNRPDMSPSRGKASPRPSAG
jgi:hypothetical protein